MSKISRVISRSFPQTGFFLAIMAACPFVSFGRPDWVMGWVLLGLFAVGYIGSTLVIRVRNPGLLGERASLKGKRNLDRVLAGIMALFGPAAICIVSGLNLRFGWQPEIPPALQLAGIAIAVLGSVLTGWAMGVNRFFYGVLRITKDRGHAVCDAGPYRFLRHPGYLGAIVFDLAAPFALGSAWAFIPAFITVIAIMVRTAMEDKALQAGLDGYHEYARRVPSRLLPRIW